MYFTVAVFIREDYDERKKIKIKKNRKKSNIFVS